MSRVENTHEERRKGIVSKENFGQTFLSLMVFGFIEHLFSPQSIANTC